MHWGEWVLIVGHWVVLVQVTYCFKGGWIFLKSTHSWEEIVSYSHNRKPDAPVPHSPPLRYSHNRKTDFPITHSSPLSYSHNRKTDIPVIHSYPLSYSHNHKTDVPETHSSPLSYRLNRKPDVPITHSSPLNMWHSVLFFSSLAHTLVG